MPEQWEWWTDLILSLDTLNEVMSLGKRWEAAEENLSDKEGWTWDAVLGGRWGRLLKRLMRDFCRICV